MRLTIGMVAVLLAGLILCSVGYATEDEEKLLQKIKLDYKQSDYGSESLRLSDISNNVERSAMAPPVLATQALPYLNNSRWTTSFDRTKLLKSPIQINAPRLNFLGETFFGLFKVYNPQGSPGIMIEFPNNGKIYVADANGGITIDHMAPYDWVLMGMSDCMPVNFLKNSDAFYKVNVYGSTMNIMYSFVIWRDDSDANWHYAMRVKESKT